MAYWDEFMEEDEKAEVKAKEKEVKAEVKEVKAIPIKPMKPIKETPVVYDDTLTKTEVRAYIREFLEEVQIGKIEKEQKIEIDPIRLYNELRSLDPEAKENAYYSVIIKRAKSGRKESYLTTYVNFINENFEKLKKR